MSQASKNFTITAPASMSIFQNYVSQLTQLFKPRPVALSGQRLYATCVTQARLPVFYLDYGVEDAIGARFEMLAFHVGLVIERLKAVAVDDPRREQAQEMAQALFDALLSALDNTLREQGTGDLSVPKKMKKLGEVIYTRMRRWDELWHEDAAARSDYVARTILAGGQDAGEDGTPGDPVKAQAFAAYAETARQALDIDALLAGHVAWPEPADAMAEEH